jgi:hypothetical protein
VDERASASADIKLVCDLCYEHLRERNSPEHDQEFDQLLSGQQSGVQT